MTPELQNMLNAQQQAFQQAADMSAHMQFLAYSTYAGIIICAIFSMLIFWKLCQIQKQLAANSQGRPSNPFLQRPPAAPVIDSASNFEPLNDETRFMPKK